MGTMCLISAVDECQINVRYAERIPMIAVNLRYMN